MRTLAIAALLLCVPMTALGLAEDKIKHASVSAAITVSARQVFDDTDSPWLYAHASCLAVGVAKEIYDEIDYGGFDMEDLAADAAGSLAGSLLGMQFESGMKLDYDPARNRIRFRYPF